MATLPRPYYDHGGITIYHGDCREILPLLGRFDLLLSDPPYGTGHGKGYAKAKRSRVASGYCRAVPKDYPEIAGDSEPFDPSHVLGASSARVLWGANHFADKLPASSFWLCWDRQCGLGAGTITDAELAWTTGTTFKTVRMFRHLWAGYHRASEAGSLSLHPTQKPVALMSWCLDFFPDAKSVIDPYMGSGPIAKACKDRGLRYVGIDLVETYCERAVERLAQEVLF